MSADLWDAILDVITVYGVGIWWGKLMGFKESPFFVPVTPPEGRRGVDHERP
ncbi:MAG TPA: hypothetical protein VEI97_06335 [bacterium]|nr:hypothetical protein [bacterium]